MHDRRTAMRIQRAALDLTQFAAARAAGMHPQRYHRIEKGLIEPTPAEADAIAAALQTTKKKLHLTQPVTA